VTIKKEGKSASWRDGYDAGFGNLVDCERIRNDPEYLEGAVEGAMAWEMFIASEDDHDEGFVQRVLMPPSFESLSSLKDPRLISRHRVPAGVLEMSHIRWGCPDLSDLDGTTETEDQILLS
jgi:hypothetical protein